MKDIKDPFQKIDFLRKSFDGERLEWLGSVERSLKRSLARIDLKENHIGFSDLLQLLNDRVKMIRDELQSPRNILENNEAYLSKQIHLLALKESYEWFISLFNAAESNVKSIETRLNQEIDDK